MEHPRTPSSLSELNNASSGSPRVKPNRLTRSIPALDFWTAQSLSPCCFSNCFAIDVWWVSLASVDHSPNRHRPRGQELLDFVLCHARRNVEGSCNIFGGTTGIVSELLDYLPVQLIRKERCEEH